MDRPNTIIDTPNAATDVNLPVFCGLKDGHAGFEQVEAHVHLRTDASPEAVTAPHDDVFRASPVGNTLERPAALRIQLVPIID